VLNFDPAPAASALPASPSTGPSAARGKDPSAAAGAFDSLLSQLTGRSTERPRSKGTDAGALPPKPQAQPAASPIVDPFAALRQSPGAVATRPRPSGAKVVADTPTAHAAAQPADDQQAIANSLMWLIVPVGTTKPEVATPATQAGTSADAHGTPQGVAGALEIGAAGAPVPGVGTTTNTAGKALATRVRTTQFAAVDRSGVDSGTTPDAARGTAPPQPAQTSTGALDTPSSGRVSAAPLATAEQIASLASVGAEQTAETTSATPASNVVTTSLTNNTGTAGSAPAAVTSTPIANAGAARPAIHASADSPAINVAAPGPVTGGPVPIDAAAQARPASVAGVAPRASAVIRAAGDQPPASKSVAPAAAFAGVPVVESRSADARGAAAKDGRGSDERPAEASMPRPAAAMQSAGVFQMPMETRAVGGVSTAASVADVGAAHSLSPGHDAELPNQIVQAIRLQWADGVGDARITLKPEYLGELSIAIRVDHGAVSATLESAVPAVREWIDSHSPMLREALAVHGLELAKLTTAETHAAPERKRDEQPEPRQQHQDPRQPQQQQRRRGTTDTPAFEVIA
jgi:flagellar hook-length control protein FliK